MNKHGPSFGAYVVVLGLAAEGAIAAGMVIDRMPPVALVNESPSLPRGVYSTRRERPARARRDRGLRAA